MCCFYDLFVRLCEIPRPFIRSLFWSPSTTRVGTQRSLCVWPKQQRPPQGQSGNVQMLNWQLRVQLPHLLKMMLQLLLLVCFEIRVFFLMSLNLFAPIRNGPNLTIQNHTRFEKQKRPIFTSQKKNSGSFCANGDLAVSGKNRAPLLPEAQSWLCSKPAACSGAMAG